MILVEHSRLPVATPGLQVLVAGAPAPHRGVTSPQGSAIIVYFARAAAAARATPCARTDRAARRRVDRSIDRGAPRGGSKFTSHGIEYSGNLLVDPPILQYINVIDRRN